MSATNSTLNYELPQFIATDKPAWLVDFNGAMSTIDTAIKEAKTAGDNAQQTANTNATNIQTLDGTVTSQGTAIGTLGTTVAGNTGSINTINSLIGDGTPTTTNKTIIGAINELHSDIQGLSDPDADDVSFDNTNTGLSATDVQAAIVEVKGLIPSGPGSVDADDVSYSNTSSGLTATDVQAAIDEVDAKIDALPAPIDLDLSSNVTATVTATSAVSNLYGSEVHVLTNADGSIGKVYGYASVYFNSVPTSETVILNIAASNIPTISASYDIFIGAVPMLNSTGNSMRFALRFNTDNTISVVAIAGGASTNEAVMVSLPPCLYILKDLGD